MIKNIDKKLLYIFIRNISGGINLQSKAMFHHFG